jgi:hypothetical protein
MRERRKAPRYAFGLTGQLHRPGERVGTKVVVPIISTNDCAVEGRPISAWKKCEVYFDWHNLHVGVEAEVASIIRPAAWGFGCFHWTSVQGRLKDVATVARTRDGGWLAQTAGFGPASGRFRDHN